MEMSTPDTPRGAELARHLERRPLRPAYTTPRKSPPSATAPRSARQPGHDKPACPIRSGVHQLSGLGPSDSVLDGHLETGSEGESLTTPSESVVSGPTP